MTQHNLLLHSALVPYLGEKNGGKRKLQDTEEAFILTTTLLRSLVTSSTHLLMIGAVKIPFVYMLNDFVKILLEAGKNLGLSRQYKECNFIV